jgi:AcrR family transcriptional regulator
MDTRAPQPKTRRGEATRRAILSAAERVMGTTGYTDASISEITREAGVGQGTFYIYFRGKDEIFRELVLEMGRDLRHALSEATRAAPNRLLAEKEGLRAFLEFAAGRPNLYRIIQESMFVDPEAYQAYFEAFANSYREALVKAEAAGEVSPGDAEVRAWALMGLAKYFGERYALWQEKRPIPEVVEAAYALIAQGLQP